MKDMNKNLYSEIKKGKLFKLSDVVIISGLIAVIAISYIFYAINRQSGNYAEIYGNGVLVKVMPLSVDAEYRYTDEEGGYNIIAVKDGKISVTEANCQDKICAFYPPQNAAGSMIICLPHKLVIIVKGEREFDETAG
jgi:hypothetical protein